MKCPHAGPKSSLLEQCFAGSSDFLRASLRAAVSHVAYEGTTLSVFPYQKRDKEWLNLTSTLVPDDSARSKDDTQLAGTH